MLTKKIHTAPPPPIPQFITFLINGLPLILTKRGP